MDDATLTTAIEVLIEETEDAHPEYEIQVLVEPGTKTGTLQLEVMAIHRETQMVTRIHECGTDLGVVLAVVGQTIRAKLPGRSGTSDKVLPSIDNDGIGLAPLDQQNRPNDVDPLRDQVRADPNPELVHQHNEDRDPLDIAIEVEQEFPEESEVLGSEEDGLDPSPVDPVQDNRF